MHEKRYAVFVAFAVLSILFSGCALYGSESQENAAKVETEVASCGADDMAFGVDKLPCCTLIEGGKCAELVDIDPNATYTKMSPENPNEACSIDDGTCENIDLEKTVKKKDESPETTQIFNQTINLCPTFVKSVCMENCTTGVFKDIKTNENPGLTAADVHQLKLIFGDADNGSKVANNINSSGLNIKRTNLLYSEGAYQAIDDRVANDLKKNAAMDIFRFGVGKSFADFDEARILLPYSTEEVGELSQSGVESFALYYYPKSAIRSCVMDLAAYGYRCNSTSKVFPTFESCLLNCVSNSNRLKASDIEALNMIMRNKPLANDTLLELFYSRWPLTASSSAGSVLDLAAINSYVSSTTNWQPRIRLNVSEYLLDEFGELGDSFVISNEVRIVSISNVSMPSGGNSNMTLARYNVSNPLRAYSNILSLYDSSTYSQTFSLVDGKKKAGLPFECSGQDCKSGMCSMETYYRTGCKSASDPNVDVKCGCDTMGCYAGTYTGSIFTKGTINFLDQIGKRVGGVGISVPSSENPMPSQSHMITTGDGKQYFAIAMQATDSNSDFNNYLGLAGDSTGNPGAVSEGPFEIWDMVVRRTLDQKCNDNDGYVLRNLDGSGYRGYGMHIVTHNAESRHGWWQTLQTTVNTISTITTSSGSMDTQYFGDITSIGPSGSGGYNTDATGRMLPLADQLLGYLSTKYVQGSWKNVPLFQSCGVGADDVHSICVNPKILNQGGIVIGENGYVAHGHSDDCSPDTDYQNVWSCRRVQYVSSLTLANGTGDSDDKKTISSARNTCNAGDPGSNYILMHGAGGGPYVNSIALYGNYTVPVCTAVDAAAGTCTENTGICEQLTSADFCFQTDANGDCVKEATVMEVLSPGADKKYGECDASNGYAPDVNQYGMCTNPSYVSLAVQKISPASLYFNISGTNLGYAPASAATASYQKEIAYNYSICFAGTGACHNPTSETYKDKPMCSDSTTPCTLGAGGNDMMCRKTGTETCSKWSSIYFCSSGTEACKIYSYNDQLLSVHLVREYYAYALPTQCVFNSSRWAWEWPAATSPSCSGYTYCYLVSGTYNDYMYCSDTGYASKPYSTVGALEPTINFSVFDPKRSGTLLAQVPNSEAISAMAAPDFWPPYDYLKNKTRDYLQNGISVMLFADHPDLYRMCYNSTMVNYSCKDNVATPFMTKLLNDIYNKSNNQTFVPVGSVIVVTGRATPYDKDCTDMMLPSAETRFCTAAPQSDWGISGNSQKVLELQDAWGVSDCSSRSRPSGCVVKYIYVCNGLPCLATGATAVQSWNRDNPEYPVVQCSCPSGDVGGPVVLFDCPSTGTAGTTSTQFCSYSKDQARYNTSYYPTTADLLQRNSLVKSMCPGCRTAVEVAGSLKEINGAFTIQTQRGNEADVLMTTFKEVNIDNQVTLEDIYDDYGITQRPRPSAPDPMCLSESASDDDEMDFMALACTPGYRVSDVTTKYGEVTYTTSPTTYTGYWTNTFTLPNGTKTTISGTGSYMTNKEETLACNSIGTGYCSYKNVPGNEMFFFDQKTVDYSVQVPAYTPENGWNGVNVWGLPDNKPCAATQIVDGVPTACPAKVRSIFFGWITYPCTCIVPGTPTTTTEWKTWTLPGVPLPGVPHKEITCSIPICTDPWDTTCKTGACSGGVGIMGETCTAKPNCINVPFLPSAGICTWNPPQSESGCNTCNATSATTADYSYRACTSGSQACVIPTSGTNEGKLVCSSNHNTLCVQGAPNNDMVCLMGSACDAWSTNLYCSSTGHGIFTTYDDYCTQWMAGGAPGYNANKLVCRSDKYEIYPTSCVFSSLSWAWTCPESTHDCEEYSAFGSPVNAAENPSKTKLKTASLEITCDSRFYPVDFMLYWMLYDGHINENRAGYYSNLLTNEIMTDNAANSAGMDATMCTRDSDIRTYYIGKGCNDAFNTTDMLVLNLEIDPATTRHTSADYEAWYTEMADAIVNYSSSETYTYGKPIVIYIRSMKNASGFNPEKFMTVLGINMERMINAGVVAIHFEDWKQVSTGGQNAYVTDQLNYSKMLYAFDASGRPTQTFSALSDLGRAISKKISFSVAKSTPVYNETTCLNSSTPCIADSACIEEADIGTMNITCYNSTGAVKIVYAMHPSSSEEDMAQIFSNPDKYKSIIGSVNRYSNRKLCISSIGNSTYFTSYMSNAGYGIPVAWDQLQGQTCTATGLTNAEVLSLATGGASAYVCRLE